MAALAATHWSSFSDLVKQRSVSQLTVIWPASGTRQVFENVAAGQSIVITEGEATFKVMKQPEPIASHASQLGCTSHRGLRLLQGPQAAAVGRTPAQAS